MSGKQNRNEKTPCVTIHGQKVAAKIMQILGKWLCVPVTSSQTV